MKTAINEFDCNVCERRFPIYSGIGNTCVKCWERNAVTRPVDNTGAAGLLDKAFQLQKEAAFARAIGIDIQRQNEHYHESLDRTPEQDDDRRVKFLRNIRMQRTLNSVMMIAEDCGEVDD